MRCFLFDEQTDSLPRLLARQEWVAVLFTAPWSGPCQYLDAEVEKFARAYPEVLAVSVNTDANPNTVMNCQVSTLPTMAMYWRGQEVHRFIGICACDQWIEVYRGIAKYGDSLPSAS